MRTTSSHLYAHAHVKGVNCSFFPRVTSAPSARRRRTASASPFRHAYIRSSFALSCLSASTRSVADARSPASTLALSSSTLHSSSSRALQFGSAARLQGQHRTATRTRETAAQVRPAVFKISNLLSC